MAHVRAPLYSCNGGEVGPEALTRFDLERMQFAGSLCQNFMPRIIGSMTIRPGLEYVTDIDFGNVMLMEYSYSGDSTLIPILSANEMRVVKDGALVSRVSVSTSVTSPEFNTLTGWTDVSTGAATAASVDGFLALTATNQDEAGIQQQITVSVGDQGKEHAVRVKISNGPVNFWIGTAAGESDILNADGLERGEHSFAFTPAGDVWFRFGSTAARIVRVDSCAIEAPGVMILPTPWAGTQIASNEVRYRQSIDIVYCAHGLTQQREIQRRSDTSWGLQIYKVDDGPFTIGDDGIAMTPSAYTGNVQITSSKSYFTIGMVGRLLRLIQSGQTVVETFTAYPQEGAPIRISGVGDRREFDIEISGTWTGSLVLEAAVDDGTGSPSSWTTQYTYTTNGSAHIDNSDIDDNVIKFHRFRTGSDFAVTGSNSAVATLVFSSGRNTGVVRILNVTSPTTAGVEVLERLYSLNPSFEWDHTTWSNFDGWPGAVEVFGGRLYWFNRGDAYGSVPDEFRSFDDTIEGDSAPIQRSIGSGSHRGALSAVGLQRLIVHTDSSEISIKASGYDEPITPDAWFPADASTRGSANLRAIKADKDGIFVQSSKTALFRMAIDQAGVDYAASDLTSMHEHICDGSPIVDIAIQRRPDTVIWCVLENGEARALTYEPSENVISWSRIVTDGQFKRVCATRGAGQDAVHFAVQRNGALRLERLANYADCRGGSVNCIADGFKRFTGVTAQTVFAVPHLANKSVVVWVNGVARHDMDNLYAVPANGNVTLAAVTGNVVIGLPYQAKWKSTKLAYGAQTGTALFARKRIARLGLYLVKTMLDGLRVGGDFAKLAKLTTSENGKPIPAGHLFEEFDADLMPVPGSWTTDSRVCIQANAPYPFTLGGLVMDDKVSA